MLFDRKNNRRDFLKLMGLAGICMAGEDIFPAESSYKPEKNRPNILIITVDNLGYGDLMSYNKNSPIKTPNLDRLARQGARLINFYTASPTSSASRAALLTGRLPQRNMLDYQLAGIDGNWGTGLRHSEIIIPQIVKKSPGNYSTGEFGKWNIGFAEGSKPDDRGFDEFICSCSGNIDYIHHIYDGKHDLYDNNGEIYRDGQFSTDIYANGAIDFINKKTKASVPWFVYLPFNAPHYPKKSNLAPGQLLRWQTPDWALEAYGLKSDETDPRKRYNAVVTALDDAIGRVLSELDLLGIADNTFVFFFSDNGAFMIKDSGLEVASNLPLRDGGVTLWEGGIRVAALARWPGKIKAGSVIDVPLWSPDLLVACTNLAGAELPEGLILDGKDPLPVLQGKSNVSPHETLFFQFEKHAALLWGNWKIVRTDPDQTWQLFNLKEDISESKNCASEHPDIVEKLQKAFYSKQEEIKNYHKSEANLNH
jgi:arylsulfatase A